MSWSSELQPKLGVWRDKKYPDSTDKDIALKLGEEVGEVQAVVFKMFWASNKEEYLEWWHRLPEELGDVGLTFLSLCEYFNFDGCKVIEDRAKEKGMIDE